MRRRHLLQTILVATAALQGCSGMPSMGSMGSASVVDSLTSQLGVTPQQATGGVGSMLSYAKGQLSPSDFSTVASALPGADKYMSLASEALGVGPISSTAALGSAFSKLGMSPDMVSKFAPIVTDYAGKYGSAAAKNLLAGVFK
jgi:hypothetical protein